jgi:uncharacterized protein YkwD
MMRTRLELVTLIVLVSLTLQTVLTVAAPTQTPELVSNEAQTVYLGNLARRQNGVPPLRWNKQITDSARWFSWDSVENRSNPYCGHMDTLGRNPDTRVPAFGYKGGAGAENAFCGYVTPQQAIEGWMNSPGHRGNLLDPNSREIGLGYYLRSGDGRGYVAQPFGHDPVYPPVVIENEAINTTSASVNLYIYNREANGAFTERMDAATLMMVSHDACFAGATWEPYASDKTWSLISGTGWRTVYVKERDALNRTTTVSDTIYLGASVPLNELGDAQMSSTRSQVTLYNLNGGGLSQVQFSPGWILDDAYGSFNLWWGNGGRVNDPAGWGSTAFRLYPGSGESFAWVYTTEFYKDIPYVAYFRLKVNNNTSNAEVARISVKGGGTEYGLTSLKGTAFSAANQYQEFAVPFVFHTNSNDPFLIFNIWRSGSADVYFDAITLFTAPQPLSTSITWALPSGNYRGQGVWVRYTNGSNQFSTFSEGATVAPSLNASPGALTFLAKRTGPPPAQQSINVVRTCGIFTWQVNDNAVWLTTQPQGDTVAVSVNQSGLGKGTYQGTVTISAVGVSGVSSVNIPVTLVVVEQLSSCYLPFVRK